MAEIDIFSKNNPVRSCLATISGKWGLLIILALAREPMRFSELVRYIEGISDRMASQTLKYLERYGIVRRHVLQTAPPAVRYELTMLGKEFVAPLQRVVTTVERNATQLVWSDRSE